jgi:hypothetical protein
LWQEEEEVGVEVQHDLAEGWHENSALKTLGEKEGVSPTLAERGDATVKEQKVDHAV